jgi:hypothetical protein
MKQEMENEIIGQAVPGKGIYLGVWKPRENTGRRLGGTFDIYAAPEDVRKGNGALFRSFENAVKNVASLENFHGHNGGYFANERDILDAARNNPLALEEWFIPTKEILHGKDVDDDEIQAANLYDSRSSGSFKGTFVTDDAAARRDDRWLSSHYWSCTEDRTYPSLLHAVDFKNGSVFMSDKGNTSMSVRVVRAELR